MNHTKTLVVAALTALLTLGVSPPAVAGGDIGFGIHFDHRHHHHYRPHKHYRPHTHYRRHPYPRYYRRDYYYEPWPYSGPIGPWAYRRYGRYRECYFRRGHRYCRWVYH